MSRPPITTLLAVLLAASLLAACGNKGPLVRPSQEDAEDVSPDETAADAETSADEAADDVPVDDAGDPDETDADDGEDPPTPPDAGNG